MAGAPPLGRSVLLAVAAGVAAGLLARLLFAVLPDPWNTLANTSALWGLAPFLVGYVTRTTGWISAALGILTLALTVVTWVVLSPTLVTERELIMWGVMAVLAGALCGFAGGLSRTTRPWMRRTAIATIAGLVVGEGLYGILIIGGPQWWLETLIGLALPFALTRRPNDWPFAVGGASVIACALFGAYLLYDAIAAAG